MAAINPFSPGASAKITTSNTSASVAVPAGAGYQLRLVNDGTTTAFVKTGTGTTTATNDGACMAMSGPSTQIITFPQGHDTIACILASGTGVLWVTRGDGF